MMIDGNELVKKELRLNRAGKPEEGLRCKLEFLKQVKESDIDHCSCKVACRHHGNCYECVILHRAHQDHLPYCFWEMLNEKLKGLSQLTENSLLTCENSKND